MRAAEVGDLERGCAILPLLWEIVELSVRAGP